MMPLKLSALPLPVKLLLGAILLLVLLALLPKVAGLLGYAAAALWVLALAGLVQAAGLMPAALRDTLVGKVARAMVLDGDARPAPQAGARAAPAATAPAAEDDRRPERARVAEARLRALRGDDPVRTEILEQILPRARSRQAARQRLLGAERGYVVLVSGPPGVGKSTVAEVLAELFYALDVVATSKIVRVEAPTGRLSQDWRTPLQDGLDGVVLADNAGWLAEADPLTAVTYADAFFRAVIETAERYPGRLMVVVTLSDTALAPLAGRPGLREVIRRLTFRQLAMSALPPEVLVELLEDGLRARGLALPPALRVPARRLITLAAEADGPAFDHAEAMRRAAERLEERVTAAGRREVAQADLEAVLDGG